jgi:two-component system, sensor histidine kinase and response regulator
MNSVKSTIFLIIKRKETIIYFVLIIAGTSLFGWVSGRMDLAAVSLKFIPIAPATSLVFIALSILFLISIKYEKSRFIRSLVTSLIILIAFYCSLIFLDYLFNFTWDIENIFIKNPENFGNVSVGRMSPITSLLFIIHCISLLSNEQKNSSLIRYIGGSFSLLEGLISSVLLIGYLYKAPLLYGSKIVPVSLLSAICFLLFSITLLRVYVAQFWSYNLIKDNRVTRLLLIAFLPIVVLMVVLQGFLITNFPIVHNNPTLSVALILLIIISITILLLFRISAIIGSQLSRVERQLKESEEKFRSILENSADAIFITNQKGQYVYTNKAVMVMLGYTNEEMMSKTIVDLSPKDKIDEYLELFKRIIIEGRVFAEIELLKKDGNFISTDLNTVLLADGLIYGSCRDITERKHTEQALEESEKQLLRLNEDKNRFISILGHDLKSPFNNILGFSEVLTEDLGNLDICEIENIAKDINNSAKITYQLLEDILMWARTQQGSIPFNPQNLSLSATCRNILEILNPSAYSKNITIYDSSLDQINVYADADMLKTILLNLVSNAIKFTNSGGKIIINAEQNSENVMISVSDSGIGIPPENLAKLFNISEVLTTKGTAGETGTGLGILLCKEFVEKHQGKIWVESDVGKGSDIKFTLPTFKK